MISADGKQAHNNGLKKFTPTNSSTNSNRVKVQLQMPAADRRLLPFLYTGG